MKGEKKSCQTDISNKIISTLRCYLNNSMGFKMCLSQLVVGGGRGHSAPRGQLCPPLPQRWISVNETSFWPSPALTRHYFINTINCMILLWKELGTYRQYTEQLLLWNDFFFLSLKLKINQRIEGRKETTFNDSKWNKWTFWSWNEMFIFALKTNFDFPNFPSVGFEPVAA